ncbi:MAG: hypothetical protein VB070_06965 [Clostridiaceae bacterium]|nr:hypothetical protein [Clostridiaceae bacterium]
MYPCELFPTGKPFSLNGGWTLYYHPETAGRPQVYDPAMLSKWPSVPAIVPGNVELDLMRAGVEPDPFYGENLHQFAKYEFCQWIFRREFTVPGDFLPGSAGCRIILRFGGIDTIADVYCNGQRVGQAADMLIEQNFDVTAQIRPQTRNEIIVHIHAAMNEARSRVYTMAMRGTGHRNEIGWLRKAPHSFGWDIAPRLLSAGLWRDVSLELLPGTRFLETYYATPKLAPDGIWLQYGYRFATDADTLEGFRVRVSGVCGDSAFAHEEAAHFISANHECLIRNPCLWWPRGYGSQPLYTVRMELLHFGAVVAVHEEKIGLRVFRLERRFTPGDQEFQFFVNDCRIFVKGTNWVPLDALHSRDAGRLDQAIELCVEAGCNTIRCWGGNVYEDHAFFKACDQAGMMVWQDFAMGNTNYAQTPDFATVIEQEAGMIIRKLRNHPCLVLWSGDNEIDYKNQGYQYPHADSWYNRVSRETLTRLVQANDPYRFFIASSPEIPAGFTADNVPEQHTWGARAWYKDDYYKNASAHFISEAGYHGCPAPSSLRRFIPAGQLWPPDNLVWAMHSTEDVRIEPVLNKRNCLMIDQVRLLAGSIPDDLADFALLSQISQAEAMKFFIERARALKGRRTGIIWWNMLDCWPQISDAVVDYYFRKKLAFHYLKRAQQPVLVLLGEVSGWLQPVIISNDTRAAATVNLSITDADTGEVGFQGIWNVPAGENAEIGQLDVIISRQSLWLIRWETGGREYGSHYMAGFPPYPAEKLKKWLGQISRLPESFTLE